jgi:carbon monoxide dehydrogenase subunit G
MATIVKEFSIDAKPADVWDALADFGAVHQRLVPGFVTACEFDGEARNITFSNGSVAREFLVTSDSEHRRLVYAIIGERVKHYSAAAQVFDDGKGGTRFNWTVDMLPNEAAPYISGQMDLGAAAMQKALGRKAA